MKKALRVLAAVLASLLVLLLAAGGGGYAVWRLHPRHVIRTVTVTKTVTEIVTKTVEPPASDTLTVRFGSFGCAVPKDHHYIIRAPAGSSSEGAAEGAPASRSWDGCVLVMTFSIDRSSSFFQVWDLENEEYWGPFAWSNYQSGDVLQVCYGHKSGCSV